MDEKKQPADMSEADCHWMLIDDHVDLCNLHRANNCSPSGKVAGDESVCLSAGRWHGLGLVVVVERLDVDIGLPMCVALD